MITKILRKYPGFTDYWYPDLEGTIYEDKEFLAKHRAETDILENWIMAKWKSRISKGHYGFSLSPCPVVWYNIIDEFLQYMVGLESEGKISDFQIQQQKVKFGGLRSYVSYDCQDEELAEFLRLQIEKLENHLYDKKLIY